MQQFDYVSVKQAAALVKRHPFTILKAIRTGKLTATKIGQRDYSIKPEWLQAWIDNETVNPEASKAGGSDDNA